MGAPVSFEEITSTLEQLTGAQFTRKVRTLQEATDAIAAKPSDFTARFTTAMIEGKGTLWEREKTYLAQHPSDYKTLTFQQFAEKKLKGQQQ